MKQKPRNKGLPTSQKKQKRWKKNIQLSMPYNKLEPGVKKKIKMKKKTLKRMQKG